MKRRLPIERKNGKKKSHLNIYKSWRQTLPSIKRVIKTSENKAKKRQLTHPQPPSGISHSSSLLLSSIGKFDFRLDGPPPCAIFFSMRCHFSCCYIFNWIFDSVHLVLFKTFEIKCYFFFIEELVLFLLCTLHFSIFRIFELNSQNHWHAFHVHLFLTMNGSQHLNPLDKKKSQRKEKIIISDVSRFNRNENCRRVHK